MEQSKRSMELQLSRSGLECTMLKKQLNDQKNLYQIERKKKQRLKDKINKLKVTRKALSMYMYMYMCA